MADAGVVPPAARKQQPSTDQGPDGDVPAVMPA